MWMVREEPVAEGDSHISCKSTQFHIVKGKIIKIRVRHSYMFRLMMHMDQENSCKILIWVHEMPLTYWSNSLFKINVLACRSLFGGQTLDIDGRGFGQDLSLIEVTLGDHQCNIVSHTDTEIVCVTTSSATVHHINNNE